MTVGFILETLPIKIFNALRYGYTPTMASVSIFFVAVAAAVFGLIARYGDLPRLLGAWSAQERERGGTRVRGERESGPPRCTWRLSRATARQMGRAPCRASVWEYGSTSVVSVP